MHQNNTNPIRENWPAIVGVLVFVALIALYVLELRYFFNSVEISRLLFASELGMAALLGGLFWRFRDRWTPIQRHLPGLALIAITALIFAPLLGSWLNRLPARSEYQTFQFVAERAWFKSGYGLLKDESIQPNEYHLWVMEDANMRQFKYKQQPYFPMTQPGQDIQLPMRKGLLGVRVMELR
jgi:hypothetical protein